MTDVQFLRLLTRKQSSVLAMLIIWNLLLTAFAICVFFGFDRSSLSQAITIHAETLQSGAGFLGASGMIAVVYWSYRAAFFLVHTSMLGFYAHKKASDGS